LDRKGFIDILTEGQGKIGGAMMPPPDGVWGLSPDMLKQLPGYDPDVQKNRAEAPGDHAQTRLRAGPQAQVKVTARNIPTLRDPAVILVDQLKEIYIDGEPDIVETANWFPKLARKDFQVGFVFDRPSTGGCRQTRRGPDGQP
jgi:peptide/nickel transport system substrate-binding protein